MNEFTVRLDLAKGKARQQQTVFVRQGDKSGTTIRASITDHGAAAATSGLTARFSMRLPDGTHYYRKAASLSGNTATVTIDEAQAASIAGRTDVAYFQLLQGSTVVASTESFTVIVLPDALADAEPSESYDSAIQDAIDALDAAVEQMPDMVEDVLADHPEWTTTVQDGSITKAKLATDLARDRERLLYRLDNLLTNTLAEGELASATDAAKTPVAGLSVYGRSTQDGTPTPSAPVSVVSLGALNVAQFTNPSETTKTGITFTPLDDALKANGTSTSNSFISTAWTGGVLPAGKHMASVRLVSGTCTSFKCRVGRNMTSNAFVTEALNVGDEAHVWFTANGTDVFTVAPSIPSGAVATNAVFVAQIEYGQSASPYVPYGNAGLWARGKNLLPYVAEATATANGVSLVVQTDGGIRVTGTATANGTLVMPTFGPIEASGTFSYTKEGTAAAFAISLRIAGTSTYADLNQSRTSVAVDGSFDRLHFYALQGNTYDCTIYPQLEVGSTATAYQPYVTTVTPIDLDGHELRSLPDGTRDEVTVDEYGHAVLTRRTGFVSTETLAAAGKTVAEFANVVRISYANVLAGEQSRSYNGNPAGSGWCNVAPYVNNYTQNAVHAYAHNAYAYVFAPKADKSAWNATTATEWTNEHALELVYALATPVTIDLGYVAAVPLCGPDLTAQAIPTAPMQLTYERDLNATLARLESAIADVATS